MPIEKIIKRLDKEDWNYECHIGAIIRNIDTGNLAICIGQGAMSGGGNAQLIAARIKQGRDGEKPRDYEVFEIPFDDEKNWVITQYGSAETLSCFV